LSVPPVLMLQLQSGLSRTIEILPGKEMLGRIVAMLTRLVERFDTQEIRVRVDDPHASHRFPES
jgi:hypothetical protein